MINLLLAPTPFRHLISQILGYISIFFSVIVTVPQIVENYNNKSGESVSEALLWIWVVGDFLNFIGSAMQGLIFTAVLIASYFVLTSFIIIFQTYYYRIYYVNKQKINHSRQDTETEVLIESSVSGSYGTYGSSSSSTTPNIVKNPSKDVKQSTPETVSKGYKLVNMSLVLLVLGTVTYLIYYFVFIEKSFMKTTFDSEELQFWPQLFGYLSAFLYAISRVPQIMKNYYNKSCEGLSLLMFIFTVMSNLTYVASFFADSTDMKDVIVALPWILGGVISPFLDFVIFYQFYIYKKVVPAEPNNTEN
ncbi:hypothetical protein BB559_000499 [Furculomyces boomerangus]|uniref:PQ-loop repeat-containing protein n=2 Tax=Harpellales TaxID=61421 RepID=A0A2T9Z514_9FUNG|nr:hypothetical protein BB559_000499 [Furculomyces boomerangus]PVZ97501.1 hypothetical protein BB558_006547 [Smittium angustum]PVZ99633.1 hypothetical protein BB558_004333 [Smittium angustum]